MTRVTFTQGAYTYHVEAHELDQFGRMRVIGTVNDRPFTGLYRDHRSERIIVFDEPIEFENVTIRMVWPDDFAKALLEQALADAYRDARPERVVVTVDPTSGRMYAQPYDVVRPAHLPAYVMNEAASRIARFLEALGYLGIGILVEHAERVEGWARNVFIIATDAVERAIEENRRQPLDDEDRPTILVYRCSNCGRLTLSRWPSDMPTRDVVAIVEEFLARSTSDDAAYRFALASDEGLPAKVRVHGFWNCGCGRS
jgi:hypothetical protein